MVLTAVEENYDGTRYGAEDDWGDEGEEEIPGVGSGVQVSDGEAGVGPGVEAVDESSVDSGGVVPVKRTN